jgi:hypothetical protein
VLGELLDTGLNDAFHQLVREFLKRLITLVERAHTLVDFILLGPLLHLVAFQLLAKASFV